MIQSPLNYTGGKYKLLPQILPLFPNEMDGFIDLFCGGCNVGINVNANHYIYNDCCEPLIKLYKTMQHMEPEIFIQRINEVIAKYSLSDVKSHGYDYYRCNSAEGLGAYNRERYIALRTDFNNFDERDDEYYIMLYVLIIYAFNNQIRFNRRGEFNLPPGKRDFNQKMHDKLLAFLNILHLQQAEFTHDDFRKFDVKSINTHDFVYVDPPYLITCAPYNEQGGWTETDEYSLLKLLDVLNDRGIRFALSNVLESKGKTNKILEQWINGSPNYRMIDLNYTYNNSSYHRQNKEKATREILVVNY